MSHVWLETFDLLGFAGNPHFTFKCKNCATNSTVCAWVKQHVLCESTLHEEKSLSVVWLQPRVNQSRPTLLPGADFSPCLGSTSFSSHPISLRHSSGSLSDRVCVASFSPADSQPQRRRIFTGPRTHPWCAPHWETAAPTLVVCGWSVRLSADSMLKKILEIAPWWNTYYSGSLQKKHCVEAL